MSPIAVGRILEWGYAHPRMQAFFVALNRHAVPWAIYAGTSVTILTGSRTANDLDIIIPEYCLGTVTSLAPKSHKVVLLLTEKMVCGDGVALRFPRRGLTFLLDGVLVEIIASGTARSRTHMYNCALTPMAIVHRMVCTVSGTAVYIANPFDVVAGKAIMQRNATIGKFDFNDCKAIVQCCQPSGAYCQERALEMGLDERVYDFMELAGLSAFINSVPTMVADDPSKAVLRIKTDPLRSVRQGVCRAVEPG
ncbi:MAG TPA: hypothetical protein VGO07_01990 [Candidatus Saccharimonadales bacterium]|nr:hypothetical protein [Candidatus Saccharimonadales bacterium]